MPYTVPYSFDLFFKNINLDGDHREIATKRKDALVEILKKSFTILESYSSGSIPKYTAVKHHSDLDIMVALHFGNHIEGKKPSEVLQKVRDALSEFRTNVRKNGQAVTLYYNTWPNVDIVPCSRVVDEQKNVTQYNIPDMNTEKWIGSNPKVHSEEMTERNGSVGDSFKKIVKMIKWWNIYHGNYLQSYHIEVMALKSLDYTLGDYSWDVYQFFDKGCKLLETYMWHKWSLVDDYLGYNDREEIKKRFLVAKEKSNDAWYKTYDKNDDHEGAIKIWKQIFGEEFPAYG